MTLRLTIENETSLPDGGPLSIEVAGRRGIDIGRDQYLDWVLPDPSRTISGRHCEIRYHDDGYWLHDVSRNGTFLNHNPQRLQEPYRLRDGDRLEIGRYVVLVRIQGEDVVAAPDAVISAGKPGEYWAAFEDAAPAISPKDLRSPSARKPVRADFADWRVDVEAPADEPRSGFTGRLSSPADSIALADDMGWAQGPPPPAVQPPPIPAPRRPGPSPTLRAEAWASDEPDPPEAFGPSADEGAVSSDWGTASSPAPPGPASLWSDIPGAGSGGAEPQALAVAPPLPRGLPPVALAPPHEAPPAPAQAAHARPDFVDRFAKGARLPAEALAWRDPGDLAEEIGELVRMSASSLKQLLTARAETKRVGRTAHQTMIQALDNNPLKFSPTVEDALRIMFGRPSSGYLDARRAMDDSFKDLKTHQVKTYSAMQHALRLLMANLDPDSIEQSSEEDRGFGALLGSRKARLWDVYTARWDTLADPHEDGMVDAFMVFFAECYDRGEKGR